MKKAVFGAALQHLLTSLTYIVEEPRSQLSYGFQLEAAARTGPSTALTGRIVSGSTRSK